MRAIRMNIVERQASTPAYILCGGRSSRFGSDKARALIGNVPQLVALSQRLAECGRRVLHVAGRPDRYRDLGIDCLTDAQPDCGPLAGLVTALEHGVVGASSEAGRWLLLVNCDQAVWFEKWCDQLWEAALTSPSARAALYFDATWQPFPSLLHRDLLGEARLRLSERQLSLTAWFGDLDSRGLVARVRSEPGLDGATPDKAPQHWSFNTVDQFNALRPR